MDQPCLPRISPTQDLQILNLLSERQFLMKSKLQSPRIQANLVVKTKGPSHEGNKLLHKNVARIHSAQDAQSMAVDGRKCLDNKLDQCRMCKLSTTEIETVSKMFAPWRYGLLANWLRLITANCINFIRFVFHGVPALHT